MHREIDLYRNWIPKHPNIVEYHRDHQDDKNYYLILELCKGGDLQEKLNERNEVTFSEDIAQKYFRQIMFAIGALH